MKEYKPGTIIGCDGAQYIRPHFNPATGLWSVEYRATAGKGTVRVPESSDRVRLPGGSLLPNGYDHAVLWFIDDAGDYLRSERRRQEPGKQTVVYRSPFDRNTHVRSENIFYLCDVVQNGRPVIGRVSRWRNRDGMVVGINYFTELPHGASIDNYFLVPYHAQHIGTPNPKKPAVELYILSKRHEIIGQHVVPGHRHYQNL
jgi:hypothetical protein